VANVFASAGDVGEASAIAVISAGMLPGGKCIGKRRGDIVGAKEVRKRIEKRRSGVGWD